MDYSHRRGSSRTRCGRLALVVLAAQICAGCSPQEQAGSTIAGWPQVADSTATTIVVVDERTCSACLTLEQVAILGDRDGEGYLEQSQWVARDLKGRFWVLQPRMGAKLFDSDGRFLQQVGVEGQGPLEFRNPNNIFVDRIGRIHIFDTGNNRESILSDDMVLVEERRTPGLVMNAAELPPPYSYVASMHTGAMEPTTLPLHVFDGGKVSVSFGDPEPRGSQSVFRRLAVDHRGWIYSASPYEYYIQVWSLSGRRVAGFHREGVLPSRDAQPAVAEPPRGMILGVRPEGGRLWVLTWVSREGPSGPPPTSIEGFQSLVEVIDLAEGHVVASTEFNELIGGFLGDGLVFGPMSTELGEPQIGVWQLRLSD